MTILQLYSILMIIIAWSLLASNNPLTLSIIIITLAICSSLILNLLISTWYAIILYLIYIGGIITIFSYFVRFRSNDSIWAKRKLQLLLLPLITIKSLNLQMFAPPAINLQLLKLYLSSNIIILLVITIILLYIIIIVIKIVKSNNGPLRGYNHTN